MQYSGVARCIICVVPIVSHPAVEDFMLAFYLDISHSNLVILRINFPVGAACPTLKKVPHVLVIHGESDGSLERMKVCHDTKLQLSQFTHSNSLIL